VVNRFKSYAKGHTNKKLEKARVYLDKALRHLKGDEDEIFSVFQMLDRGAEVTECLTLIGVDEMENEVIRKLLSKIFKYLNLSKNSK
jgi:hypothetical protein